MHSILCCYSIHTRPLLHSRQRLAYSSHSIYAFTRTFIYFLSKFSGIFQLIYEELKMLSSIMWGQALRPPESLIHDTIKNDKKGDETYMSFIMLNGWYICDTWMYIGSDTSWSKLSAGWIWECLGPHTVEPKNPPSSNRQPSNATTAFTNPQRPKDETEATFLISLKRATPWYISYTAHLPAFPRQPHRLIATHEPGSKKRWLAPATVVVRL